MNLLTGVAGRATAAGCGGLLVGVGYLAPIFSTLAPRDLVLGLFLGLAAIAGVFRWSSHARPRAFIIVTAFVAALLIALSIPLAKDGYPEVRITATGQKNPKSNASEVFARLVSAPVQGLQSLQGQGWEQRGDVSVSYQQQPATLHYSGAWGSGATLRLVRHAYSGIAEVSIGDNIQRLDLFAEQEGYIDVALPSASVSWASYLQRAAIVAGLALLFTAIGLPLASASPAWGAVLALALLTGCGTLWLLKDRSYAGSLEVVAFDARSAPARIELDAGHGFTPALSRSVKSGAAIIAHYSPLNPVDWKLGIEGGELRALRNLDPVAVHDASQGLDNGCPIEIQKRCVYEVQGAGPLRIWLGAASDLPNKAVELPAPTSDSQRLFIIVERQPGRMMVSASRAYLHLSPWENFSQWVTALRVVDQDGNAAGHLVRLQSDAGGGYRTAAAVGANEAYRVPPLARPDTGSFLGMKLFAALISVSFVLMFAATGTIVLALMNAFRSGRHLQVLASALGCAIWLGIAVIAGWPAIIGWDGFSPYIQAQTGTITLWYGLGYPIVVGGFLLLGPGALVTVWSVLATAVLLLGVAAQFLRHSSKKVSWLAPVLLCFVLPFTVVMVGMMTHLRDAMNGLMLALFSCCSFYVALKWKTWPQLPRTWVLAGLLILGAVLALLRIDNVPTLLVVATGLALGVQGISVGSLTLVTVATTCWLSVGPLVEHLVIPDRKGAAQEKRLYASTALINPLTGMLVHGKDRIPDPLYAEIHEELDKVMDADFAIKHWSPDHIRYWHETTDRRGVPTAEVNAHLRSLYLRAMKADPMLFIKLRMATFGAILGHAWFSPANTSFHDHLLTKDRNWQFLSELLGYPPAAHLAPERTYTLLEWEGRIASTLPQLLICIVIALRFRRNPLAASVAASEIVRACVFFLFAPASVFLYLYDMHLLGVLLPMMVLAEESVRFGTTPHRSAR